MGKVKKNVLSIYQLIDENNYEEAKKIIDLLYNDVHYRNKYKVEYLEKLILESEKNYLLKTKKEGLEKEKYLLLGNDFYNKEKLDEAILFFHEGYRKTRDAIFFYYLGLCYLKKEEYGTSIQNFKLYVEKGFEMIDMAYYYLSELYTYKADKALKDSKGIYYKYLNLSDSYINKYHTYTNIKNGDLFSNGLKNEKPKTKSVKLITKDEEIENLISNGKLNDVIDIYNETSYTRKVTILALLYMNGYFDLADKTYKKDKDILYKECPDEIKQYNNNKTLYKKKFR